MELCNELTGSGVGTKESSSLRSNNNNKGDEYYSDYPPDFTTLSPDHITSSATDNLFLMPYMSTDLNLHPITQDPAAAAAASGIDNALLLQCLQHQMYALFYSFCHSVLII